MARLFGFAKGTRDQKALLPSDTLSRVVLYFSWLVRSTRSPSDHHSAVEKFQIGLRIRIGRRHRQESGGVANVFAVGTSSSGVRQEMVKCLFYRCHFVFSLPWRCLWGGKLCEVLIRMFLVVPYSNDLIIRSLQKINLNNQKSLIRAVRSVLVTFM